MVTGNGALPNKEARFYEKLKDNIVRCMLCPRCCVIRPNSVGFCNTRKNIDGKLYSIVYGRPNSIAVDPIEKKPLYHFLPGSNALSLGTIGCNLECKHCQNWRLARASYKEISNELYFPDDIVSIAEELGCPIISYTYNEPTVFFEYLVDIAKIANKRGIKNVIVSNGYINQEPLKELCNYLDGANIDLKSFDDNFYLSVCNGKLEPVLKTIKTLRDNNIWVELTNLLIPGYNDDTQLIKKMCKWILDNLGDDVPLHFSAFYPHYKMINLSSTPEHVLIKARDIAIDLGLKFVYMGNILSYEGSTTYCPRCKRALIERSGFKVTSNKIVNGHCQCGEKISGVFS